MRRKIKLDDAKVIAERFVRELECDFGVELLWCYFGSIVKGKYVPGKSDIDLIIVPKEKGMFGVDAIKHMLAKAEEFKKYGTVYKKGREISLIDSMIFFDLKMVNKVREQILEKKGWKRNDK